MAGLKDIKRRIRSVKNTKKITYAMKLVSAAKLKKAQDAVLSSREYTEAIYALLAELQQEIDTAAITHPLMSHRETIRNIGVLVVGGSRGLCGAYNANLNKRVDTISKELKQKYPQAELNFVLLGKKPAEFFRNKKRSYSKSYEELSEDATQWPVDEICREIEKDFIAEKLDLVMVVATRFRSAMSQEVISAQLLPVEATTLESDITVSHTAGNKIFEPAPELVFEAIIPRIVRTVVHQAGLDAKASELGSRMVAMDAATKNAGELVDKLTLTHNKLRQSAITAELLDIIGGAEALN